MESRRALLARGRRAAEVLRRELQATDGSLRCPYFRRFARQLSDYRRTASRADVFAAAALADLVYVGDFHAVPACQAFAADLLAHVSRRVPRVALGVEFLHTRQQHLLDLRQSGALDDESFLRRVRWCKEWGYPWPGFRILLDRARTLGVPVHALDAGPRGGFAALKRRDRHAARRIEALLRRDPGTRLLVLFGESHVARPHLPRRVKSRLRRAGLERREIVVFQNPDRLYWRALEDAGRPIDAVQVGPGVYAVFHTTPLEKYESYRQVLERWRDDVGPDEDVDLTPAVHHLIGVILGWLGIRAARRRIDHSSGWSEELADAYPEVYGGREATALLVPVLAEFGRPARDVAAARDVLDTHGGLYDAQANAVFLRRYSPAVAAAEAARFVRAALTRRLFLPAPEAPRERVAATCVAAYEDALSRLAASLVAPFGEAVVASASALPPAAAAGAVSEEQAPGEACTTDLGARLGQVWLERLRRGDLDARALGRLFRQPLSTRNAAAVVARELRGSGGRLSGCRPRGSAPVPE